MRCIVIGTTAVLLMLGTAGAQASLLVRIDKSTQRMTISVDGAVRHVFRVSTGRAGYGTPNGHFRPQRLARNWFSKKYYNSPMPHSIFFHGGFAIHGSYEISRLGGPASHGCVRLHPSNASTLYALVQNEGPGNTRIVVEGANPVSAARRPHRTPAGQSPWQDADEPEEAGGYPGPWFRPAYRAPIYRDPAAPWNLW